MDAYIDNRKATTKECQDWLLRDANHIGLKPGDISDGYHTFDELYEHRITLYIALLKQIHQTYAPNEENPIWKTRVHSDGTVWSGWFILGIFTKPGYQITYHLPAHKWDDCEFAKVVDKAPEFDGHTSEDVLNRLKDL